MSHIHIDVENVSFGYEKGKEILKDISFHAGENDSIGLVGANGVGKSTLLKLLVGLNMNFSGSIRVEEIPVEQKTLSLVREKIGLFFRILTVSFSCLQLMKILLLHREIMDFQNRK